MDLYFIQKHIIIKYRSSLIEGYIHQLYLDLRPFINTEKIVEKWFLFDIF